MADSEPRSAAEILDRLNAERAERARLTDPTRLAIIARLVDQHGLTGVAAAVAVDHANQGIRDEHTALVSSAVLGMFTEQLMATWRAMQPVLQAIAQAWRNTERQLAELAKYATREGDHG